MGATLCSYLLPIRAWGEFGPSPVALVTCLQGPSADYNSQQRRSPKQSSLKAFSCHAASRCETLVFVGSVGKIRGDSPVSAASTCPSVPPCQGTGSRSLRLLGWRAQCKILQHPVAAHQSASGAGESACKKTHGVQTVQRSGISSVSQAKLQKKPQNLEDTFPIHQGSESMQHRVDATSVAMIDHNAYSQNKICICLPLCH